LTRGNGQVENLPHPEARSDVAGHERAVSDVLVGGRLTPGDGNGVRTRTVPGSRVWNGGVGDRRRPLFAQHQYVSTQPRQFLASTSACCTQRRTAVSVRPRSRLIPLMLFPDNRTNATISVLNSAVNVRLVRAAIGTPPRAFLPPVLGVFHQTESVMMQWVAQTVAATRAAPRLRKLPRGIGRRRPKPSRLAPNPATPADVQRRLEEDWSPEQIAAWLRREHPTDPNNSPRRSGSTCTSVIRADPARYRGLTQPQQKITQRQQT
jgi:hypothetical protein